MTRRNGALRIFLYNWPVYVATWGLSLLLLLIVISLQPRLARVALAAAILPLGWSIVSLLVSFYIYDRSGLLTGRFIPPLLPQLLRTWASVHAGLDAEIDLDAAMPGSCVGRLDAFDPTVMTSGSIERARKRTAPSEPSIPCSPAALPLPDQACDAVIVAFTAHEIRDRVVRERFFHELRRVLRPGGRLLLVEHLRDLVNGLAFGPGCLHFLPRREWLRLAADANLAIANETRITPFIMALTLERSA